QIVASWLDQRRASESTAHSLTGPHRRSMAALTRWLMNMTPRGLGLPKEKPVSGHAASFPWRPPEGELAQHARDSLGDCLTEPLSARDDEDGVITCQRSHHLAPACLV